MLVLTGLPFVLLVSSSWWFKGVVKMSRCSLFVRVVSSKQKGGVVSVLRVCVCMGVLCPADDPSLLCFDCLIEFELISLAME